MYCLFPYLEIRSKSIRDLPSFCAEGLLPSAFLRSSQFVIFSGPFRMRNVVIVGQSPGAYMCGIYTHTANLMPLIVKGSKGPDLEFSGSENVAGVAGVRASGEFIDLVERQSRNMGIEVLDEDVLELSRGDGFLEIKTSSGTHRTRALVIDSAALEEKYRSSLGSSGVFYTSDKTPYREAIVIAGGGCKVSFDVKEFLETAR